MNFILRWQLWDHKILVIQGGLVLMGLSLTDVDCRESQGCTDFTVTYMRHFNSGVYIIVDILWSACLTFQELFLRSASPKSSSLMLTTAAAGQ